MGRKRHKKGRNHRVAQRRRQQQAEPEVKTTMTSVVASESVDVAKLYRPYYQGFGYGFDDEGEDIWDRTSTIYDHGYSGYYGKTIWKKPDYEAKYADHPRYYLAYGSNLNVIQMQERCPTAMPIDVCDLFDHRLVFTVVATIEYEKDSVVPCGVWTVEPEDIGALDSYEGYPFNYDKMNVDLTLSDGRQVKAFTYFITGDYAESTPTVGYLKTVSEGYDEFGLDRSKLAQALLEAHMEEEAEFDAIAFEEQCCVCGLIFQRHDMIRVCRDFFVCEDCDEEYEYIMSGAWEAETKELEESATWAMNMARDDYLTGIDEVEDADYFDVHELDYIPGQLRLPLPLTF